MGTPHLNSNDEPAIWARLMKARREHLAPEVAEYLLSLDFDESDRVRMMELASRSEAGELTAEEKAELDSYLHIGNLLTVMQSKARVALRRSVNPQRS